jgi:hypothetical protein
MHELSDVTAMIAVKLPKYGCAGGKGRGGNGSLNMHQMQWA